VNPVVEGKKEVKVEKNTIEDFGKSEIRVCKIVTVSRHPEADKVLVFSNNVGVISFVALRLQS
jgi:tRNA-binding EMAP/Myf-like protein